jgi:hypothetical protein
MHEVAVPIQFIREQSPDASPQTGSTVRVRYQLVVKVLRQRRGQEASWVEIDGFTTIRERYELFVPFDGMVSIARSKKTNLLCGCYVYV